MDSFKDFLSKHFRIPNIISNFEADFRMKSHKLKFHLFTSRPWITRLVKNNNNSYDFRIISKLLLSDKTLARAHTCIRPKKRKRNFVLSQGFCNFAATKLQNFTNPWTKVQQILEFPYLER